MEKIIAKIFFIFGLIFIFLSFVFYIGTKIKIPFGKLPGDILIKKENFTFYFPIVTCILLSIILTLLFSLIWRK